MLSTSLPINKLRLGNQLPSNGLISRQSLIRRFGLGVILSLLSVKCASMLTLLMMFIVPLMAFSSEKSNLVPAHFHNQQETMHGNPRLADQAVIDSVNNPEAIVIVVAHDNPLNQLSKRQVQKIFMGKLRLFPETNQEITSLDFPEASNIKQDFYEQLLKLTPSKLAKYRASYFFSGKGRLPQRTQNLETLIQQLESNPGTIGYMPRKHKPESLKTLYVIQ